MKKKTKNKKLKFSGLKYELFKKLNSTKRSIVNQKVRKKKQAPIVSIFVSKTILLLFLSFYLILHSFFLSPSMSKTLVSPSKSNILGNHNKKITTLRITPVPEKTGKDSGLPIAKVEAANTDEKIGYCLTVPIILYHHVEPMVLAEKQGHAIFTVDSDVFDSQMHYLVDHGYTSLSVDQVVQSLINHNSLPTKSVVITIDDGYDDNYLYAYPILRKYNLIGNYMIPTGLMGTLDYMSWDNIKEMNASGIIKMYNHTWTHTALGNVPPEKVDFEVDQAKKQLEENGIPSSPIITYPYGSYNDTVIKQLKAKGFIAGLSTIEGTLQCDTYIMSLHRTHIGNTDLSEYGL